LDRIALADLAPGNIPRASPDIPASNSTSPQATL